MVELVYGLHVAPSESRITRQIGLIKSNKLETAVADTIQDVISCSVQNLH